MRGFFSKSIGGGWRVGGIVGGGGRGGGSGGGLVIIGLIVYLIVKGCSQ